MQYMVCWLSCLEKECKDIEAFGGDNEPSQKMYMIEAKCKKVAVELFLRKMAGIRLALIGKSFVDECITNMVKGIYRYGELLCIDKTPVQRDFVYVTKLVINGNYYTPDKQQGLSEEDADILGIIKEIDTEPISETIDSQLFTDVFIETYRYDVAVIALKSIDAKAYY